MFKAFAVALVALPCAASAQASRMVEQVQSPVFEAEGGRAALTRKLSSCMARNIGTERGAAVQTTDPESGVVVASTAFGYSSMFIPWSVRTTLTGEAKDGRFRLTHSALQHQQGQPKINEIMDTASGSGPRAQSSWMPVGNWRGAGGEKVTAAAQAVSEKIAACVKAPADNW